MPLLAYLREESNATGGGRTNLNLPFGARLLIDMFALK